LAARRWVVVGGAGWRGQAKQAGQRGAQQALTAMDWGIDGGS